MSLFSDIGSRSAVTLALLTLTFTLAPLAQERDRAKVPDKYKWDLTHIYPSDEAWAQAKSKIAAEIPKAAALKGEPLELTIKKMNQVMDQMEALLK